MGSLYVSLAVTDFESKNGASQGLTGSRKGREDAETAATVGERARPAAKGERRIPASACTGPGDGALASRTPAGRDRRRAQARSPRGPRNEITRHRLH